MVLLWCSRQRSFNHGDQESPVSRNLLSINKKGESRLAEGGHNNGDYYNFQTGGKFR